MLKVRSLSAVTACITALALVVAAVHADQRSARTSSRGTVAKGEEATVAVGRRGAAVATEDGAAAVGRRGAVAVGEEGAAAVGRHGGVVVGEHYESHEAWKTAAVVAGGVAAGIAIGTMLSKPPAAATTVVVTDTSYMYDDGVYYARVMDGGEVAYQVVPAPAGAIIATLPGGCSDVRVGGVAYSQCGQTHYQKVSTGYQVVVLK
jgi:Family of unknown function (DUF6515)